MRLFPDSGPLEPSLRTKVLKVMHSYVKWDENLPLGMEIFDEACFLTNVFPLLVLSESRET